MKGSDAAGAESVDAENPDRFLCMNLLNCSDPVIHFPVQLSPSFLSLLI
jgi:hypothetical protein